MSISTELDKAVKAANWLDVADAAAVAVARLLADKLDVAVEVREISELSTKLNTVLTSLGLTVAGRTGKAEPEREVSPLDALRKSTNARINNAAPTNATAKRKKSS